MLTQIHIHHVNVQLKTKHPIEDNLNTINNTSSFQE